MDNRFDEVEVWWAHLTCFKNPSRTSTQTHTQTEVGVESLSGLKREHGYMPKPMFYYFCPGLLLTCARIFKIRYISMFQTSSLENDNLNKKCYKESQSARALPLEK